MTDLVLNATLSFIYFENSKQMGFVPNALINIYLQVLQSKPSSLQSGFFFG